MDMSKITVNDTDSSPLPYLLFTVGKNTYGISSKFVRSIETLGGVVPLTEAIPNVRGGVIYQNSFIYLFDLRKMFGMDTQIEEFKKAVQPDQRIKDHEHWMRELEKSILEHTEFTLTDDPHQCDFGKWYYTFKTDNNVLKHQLKSIEAPHAAIHYSAQLIKKLKKEKNYEAALSVFEEVSTTYFKTTVQILSQLGDIVAKNLKEIYIVIESIGYLKGLIVDSIVGVEYLNATLQMPEMMRNTKYIDFLGQRMHDHSLVIVLNEGALGHKE